MSATNLIDSIINAHGGLERYHAAATITTRFHFTGALLGFKQRPEHLVVTATVSTRTQQVSYRGISASADEEWVYTPGRIWKQSISTGAVLDSRDDVGQTFAGHGLQTPWDDFQFVYFAGYALWQYTNFPFLLKRDDVKARELDPHVENGHAWRVLQVDFPPQEALASHSASQTYFVDENFALRRHDYAPEILGGETPGAHYSFDEIEAAGLKFPSLRRVVARMPGQDGSLQPLLFGPIPTFVLVVFTSYVVKDENGKELGSWALSELPKA